MIPKGISQDQLIAVLRLLAFALTPDQQAATYDNCYFYPGPAVKGVTPDQAPAASQQAIQKFGDPRHRPVDRQRPDQELAAGRRRR